MVDSQKREVKELKKELGRIDRVGKEECVMCRFVLIFSSIVLILIVLFVFFLRVNPSSNQVQSVSNEPFRSQPTTPEDFASTSLEYNQRILELGQTARSAEFNIKASAPSGTSQTTAGEAPAPVRSTEVPDGPPPVMAP